MRKIAAYTALLLIPVLLAAGFPVHNGTALSGEISLVEPPVVPLTDRFEKAVGQWISELSQQSEFSDWVGAEWRREPLGPGMHGWIVLLSTKGKEVGYLVVSVDLNGTFILSEYGHGEYPLFSESTLYRSLVRQELIPTSTTYEAFIEDTGIIRSPHYYSPLQNIWSITIDGDDYWLDGKTGELLPLGLEVVDEMSQRQGLLPGISVIETPNEATEVIANLTLPDYDPFYDLSWLTEPQLKIKDLQKLQALLDQNMKLTYVTELYDQAVLYAFAVTGYHGWDYGGPYIRLEHDGPRYVPAEALMPGGRFYSSKGSP